ncbi:Tyrosine decarboxylase 1 [Golovinomyces cichoracearum]|uniref:Tyrosine decarboxylase 1 n=1 Tax=Golovinomyces cichoracearum TaxID=62708 RepID=A0A420I2S3_9PEZI|nr:Tyrosine decarboxylase 1 [Golovinomyces cichoracearum]
MDSSEFKRAATTAIDEITSYYDTIEDRRVTSNVEPGYLKKLLPDGPPQDGEPWEEIQKDIESKIMPGVTHWQSPNFMAYFPATISYPGILGDMYSAAINSPVFNWTGSPACTELETIVLDWLAKLINLPECFTSSSNGGGVTQGSASEAIVVVMVAAREKYLNEATSHLSGILKEDAMAYKRGKLIAIGSETTHSSTQKAAQIAGVRFAKVPVYAEDNYAMTGANLEKTLAQCRARGLEPFFLTATLGTTPTCAVDDFASIVTTLQRFAPRDQPGEIWVHVDAAHAGSALICPEYHHHTAHFASFHSFNFNMHKWLLTAYDTSCLYLRERKHVISALSILPSYLCNKASEGGQVIDYRDWQIPLGRRFRSLKIWFILRSYGVSGLQENIRKHIRYSEVFASLIRGRPDLFKIRAGPSFALTVFSAISKIGKDNELTRAVYNLIHERGEIHVTPCVVGGIETIRVVSANPMAEERFLRRAFDIFVSTTEELRSKEIA